MIMMMTKNIVTMMMMTVMRMRLYSNAFSDVGDNDDGDDVGW